MTRTLTAIAFALFSTPAFAGIGYDVTDSTFGVGSSSFAGNFYSIGSACAYAEDVGYDKAVRRADAACGGEWRAIILSEEYTEVRSSMMGVFASCDVVTRIEYTCR